MKNNFWKLLLSFALAFSLWLYVITVVSPGSKDTFYHVPVVLQGETVLQNRGLIITSGGSPTVTLELEGNRSDLSKLDRSNITVIADLSRIYDPGEHELSYDISYPGSVASNAIEELSRSPGTVKVTVEQLISKEIQVVVNYSGNVPTGCIADKENAELDHKTILIEGPASVIDSITQAKINVDIDGLTESFSQAYRYTLCDAQGEPVDAQLVVTNVAQVNLSLLIQHVKEIPLIVNVVDGGGATKETTSVVLQTPTIMVAGTAAALEQIDQIELATIHLADYMRDTEITYPLNLPANLTNLTGLTHVTVSLTFPELRTATYQVTNFRVLNVPEGMEAALVTRELTVKVRGPMELVSKMTADDILVTVDLTGESLGTFTKLAAVTLDKEFSQVGIIGTYNVSVTVLEPMEAMSDDAEGSDPAN